AIKIGGTKSKFLYTGQENDSETGLDYYNARYYDPHIRRFTHPDDIVQDIYSPQTLNRYSYVQNNPLKYTDPTGHAVVFVGGKIISTLLPDSQPKKAVVVAAVHSILGTSSNMQNALTKVSAPSNNSKSSGS